jgi:hypothetical protein
MTVEGFQGGGDSGPVGHMVNTHGIPDKCPGCDVSPVPTRVIDYDMMWHDGKVVCANCGQYLRDYDAG